VQLGSKLYVRNFGIDNWFEVRSVSSSIFVRLDWMFSYLKYCSKIQECGIGNLGRVTARWVLLSSSIWLDNRWRRISECPRPRIWCWIRNGLWVRIESQLSWTTGSLTRIQDMGFVLWYWIRTPGLRKSDIRIFWISGFFELFWISPHWTFFRDPFFRIFFFEVTFLSTVFHVCFRSAKTQHFAQQQQPSATQIIRNILMLGSMVHWFDGSLLYLRVLFCELLIAWARPLLLSINCCFCNRYTIALLHFIASVSLTLFTPITACFELFTNFNQWINLIIIIQCVTNW
jgi:hypothetical protein